MRSIRVIPCLDVDQGRVVKGVNFVDLKDAGDPVEMASIYDRQGADEIVFLDITASSDSRETIHDVVRRTAEEIAEAKKVKLDDLPDPEGDEDRVQNPEWLIMVGICTHLGCIPLGQKGEYNGWFCPCHGSHYDTSGRIRKGPAPKNLEIPQYVFLDENTVKIG